MRRIWHSTLARLLAFLRPFSGWVALAVLLGVATVGSGIALLGVSAYLIATAALQPSVAVLQVAIVSVRLFGISRAVFRYLERLVSHAVNFRHLAQMRVWLYEKIEPLAPARLVYARSADLLSRAIADIDTLDNFYVRAVAPPLVALVVTVGVTAFVARYHLRLGLLLFGALVLVGAGLPLLVHALSRGPGRAVVERRARLHAALLDLVQGLPDVLAFGRGAAQAGIVQAESRALNQAQERAGRAGALGNALALLVSGLALWGMLVVAIPLVGVRFDGVTLAVLALVTLAAFEAVTPLITAAQHLEASRQAGRRLFALADAAPEVDVPVAPPPAPETARLRIDGLTFTYPGEAAPALVNFSLDLPPGRHVALVGPSGAGKSTLLHLLLRFWDAPPGAICWAGQDIRMYDPDDIRRQIALVAQRGYLFAGTLRQNLRLAQPGATDAEIEQSARQARLDSLVAQLPQGLDTWIGERGLHLSGGERQRVMLARALLRRAPLLLLDEPTANLDAATERDVLDAIWQASAGRSLLAVTHRLVAMNRFDEILVLADGQVVERGTHAALLAQNGRYARMWAIQQGTLNDFRRED